MNAAVDWIGRAALAAIFLMAGVNKIGGYAGTQAYMASKGVPGELLPAVIAVELIAPLLLVVGLFTRWAALALAGFTLLAAWLFYFDFGDRMQTILFMKNIAIIGGLLLVYSHGAGAWSLDRLRR